MADRQLPVSLAALVLVCMSATVQAAKGMPSEENVVLTISPKWGTPGERVSKKQIQKVLEECGDSQPLTLSVPDKEPDIFRVEENWHCKSGQSLGGVFRYRGDDLVSVELYWGGPPSLSGDRE